MANATTSSKLSLFLIFLGVFIASGIDFGICATLTYIDTLYYIFKLHDMGISILNGLTYSLLNILFVFLLFRFIIFKKLQTPNISAILAIIGSIPAFIGFIIVTLDYVDRSIDDQALICDIVFFILSLVAIFIISRNLAKRHYNAGIKLAKAPKSKLKKIIFICCYIVLLVMGSILIVFTHSDGVKLYNNAQRAHTAQWQEQYRREQEEAARQQAEAARQQAEAARQREAEQQRRHACDHVYAGKVWFETTTERKGVFWSRYTETTKWKYTVTGFSPTSQLVTVHVTPEGYTSKSSYYMELNCPSIPR